MIFVSKKSFERKVLEKAEELKSSNTGARFIYEVDTSGLTADSTENLLKSFRELLISQLHLKEDQFIVVPVSGTVGRGNIVYLPDNM